MASAFSDSLMASGGVWFHPPKISGTTKGMTMKFLPDVKLIREARTHFHLSSWILSLPCYTLKSDKLWNKKSRNKM